MVDGQAGKGGKYRPVDQKKYDENYDSIDWSKTRKPKESKK